MDRKEQPLVSIVIPAYNNENTIIATLESIRNQSYKNIEIIIIDDNSKDKTLQLVTEQQKKDNRIKIYHNSTNLGMIGNWNKCIQMSNGEFVKLVCADDLLDKNEIEKETGVMILNPSVNLVESDTRLIDINGKKTGSFKRYHKSGLVKGKKIARTSIIWNNFFGAPVNNLIRKSVLDKTGYFDEQFTYILDFDMWMKIACTGDVYIIHELLNSFRIRNDSNTGNLIGKDRETYVAEHQRLVDKYAGELQLNRFEYAFSIWFRKFRNAAIGIYLRVFAK
ncbi:glycosyltransferase family 2 protein [Roseburia inulinivorans]|jgi:glycosyltransferase involved in cell wall biosynthesis|uniref:Glycosyltransferase family 2 protein n=2 Tax=Roseburia inulinivorans TaxID=360807 RepID=A0A414LYZ1_9FIRM|nr:glycosyltransferase family 2 protein [Roseburia inulinivorans]RHF00083.1 glycosyltransferase family 2 protein [Roseburia inulinivorans]